MGPCQLPSAFPERDAALAVARDKGPALGAPGYSLHGLACAATKLCSQGSTLNLPHVNLSHISDRPRSFYGQTVRYHLGNPSKQLALDFQEWPLDATWNHISFHQVHTQFKFAKGCLYVPKSALHTNQLIAAHLASSMKPFSLGEIYTRFMR